MEDNKEKKEVIGLTNHKTETKEELKARLAELAKTAPEKTLYRRVMCYCPAIPRGIITITHKCENCGAQHTYKKGDYGHGASERYAREEQEINVYVDAIKELGYDIKVKHMCPTCFKKEYNKEETYISIHVLYFKHLGEDKYRWYIVSVEVCRALLGFLRGDIASEYPYEMRRYIGIIKNILGIDEL